MRPILLVLLMFSCVAVAQNSIAACNIVNGKAYGDCSNVQVNTQNNGRLEVKSQVSESGIISGATVFSGGSLSLTGMSNGNIEVQRGGKLYVSGTVNGVVKNLGGTVEIEGTVNQVENNGGHVIIGGIVQAITGSGAVIYKKGAVIGGVPTN